MGYAASARRTCRACWSAWEYTATGEMPISRQARITRTAISPRLAISSRRNTGLVRSSLLGTPLPTHQMRTKWAECEADESRAGHTGAASGPCPVVAVERQRAFVLRWFDRNDCRWPAQHAV